MSDTGVIEVALGLYAGENFKRTVPTDEAQYHLEQMKMFLTCLGLSSKAVVTGDVTQIDLPQHTANWSD